MAKKDKATSVEKQKTPSNSISPKDKPATLIEAILALGGSQEDFDLVGGDHSDIEPDRAPAKNQKQSEKNSDKDVNLDKDLKALVDGLGFDKLDRDFEPELESEQSDDDEPPSQQSEPPEVLNQHEAEQVQTQPSTKPEETAVLDKLKPPTGLWLIAPHPIWHDISLPDLPQAPPSYNLHPNRLIQLQERADGLLAELNSQYAASLSPQSKPQPGAKSSSHASDYSTLSKADKAFILTILKSGTSSDQLSALTLLASSSPIHCTSYLSQLLSLCSKKSRQESTKAVQSVVDWLKHQGLPQHRKLLPLADQPRLKDVAWLQQPKGKAPKHQKWKPGDQYLVLWAFESWLKKWFLDVLRAIEQLSNDTLPFVRTQMTGHFFELLSEKPEQEHNLLRLLVNKLGDLHRPLASKTSYFLLSVLQANPGMKPIVIREIAALVLRPVSSGPTHDKALARLDHSAYYGIITLNQVVLSRAEPEVATRLIDVYFEIFTDLLARIDHAKQAIEAAPKKTKKNQKIKQASKAELEIKAEQEEEGDSKMLAAILTGVNRAFPYAELDRETIHARLGTLFHIARSSTFTVSVQALMLIAQLSESKEGLPDRFYRALYEALLDHRLATSSKQPLFLNLLFRSIKVDRSTVRVAAFAKRLVQTLSSHQAPFVVGALHLLSRVLIHMPPLTRMLKSPIKAGAQPDLQDREGSVELELNAATAEDSTTAPNYEDGHSSALYDPRASDPLKAGAENTWLWEITPLLHHYHPAVALHAQQLLSLSPLSTSQDIDHYTLSHFLDLFIYRDPKKAGLMRGASAMQPAAPGHDKTDRVALRKGVGVDKKEAVNTERFWNLDESDVPPDQLFFHRFFNLKTGENGLRPDKAASKKRRRGSDDDSDVDIQDVAEGNDDDFASDFASDEEDEIWRVMKATLPRHEGNEDAEASDIDEDISLDLSQDESAASDDSDSEDETSNGAEDKPFVSAFPAEEDQSDEMASEDDEDGFHFSEDSLIGSDEEMDLRIGGSEPEASDAEDKSSKPKANKRRKLKHLPTFATAEDYAALLGASDDEQ